MLPETDELKHIAKLTNAATTGISELKLDDSVIKPEIQINKYDLVVTGTGMEIGLIAVLEILLVIILYG